jgi:DNA-binding response OmpR family regulator
MNPCRSTVATTRRVLVVDDDPDSRSALSALLQDELLVVSEAASLTEAASKLVAESYDLVVLDVRFDDGSGVEFIPVVRRLQRGAKVVLFTGDKEAAERSNAELFVLKGSDPAEMLMRVHSLLSDHS